MHLPSTPMANSSIIRVSLQLCPFHFFWCFYLDTQPLGKRFCFFTQQLYTSLYLSLPFILFYFIFNLFLFCFSKLFTPWEERKKMRGRVRSVGWRYEGHNGHYTIYILVLPARRRPSNHINMNIQNILNISSCYIHKGVYQASD